MGLFALVAALIPAAQASCGDLAGLSAPFQFADASAQARSMQEDEEARARGGNQAASIVWVVEVHGCVKGKYIA
jgi:hypothetical protein